MKPLNQQHPGSFGKKPDHVKDVEIKAIQDLMAIPECEKPLTEADVEAIRLRIEKDYSVTLTIEYLTKQLLGKALCEGARDLSDILKLSAFIMIVIFLESIYPERFVALKKD